MILTNVLASALTQHTVGEQAASTAYGESLCLYLRPTTNEQSNMQIPQARETVICTLTNTQVFSTAAGHQPAN